MSEKNKSDMQEKYSKQLHIGIGKSCPVFDVERYRKMKRNAKKIGVELDEIFEVDGRKYRFSTMDGLMIETGMEDIFGKIWDYSGDTNGDSLVLKILSGERTVKKTPQEKPCPLWTDHILPIPCTKGYEELTVKEWFQKINEELDELKAAVLAAAGSDEGYINMEVDGEEVRASSHAYQEEAIADEAADTITAITSMLEAMGIDEEQRQEAQRRVNTKNRERGRF